MYFTWSWEFRGISSTSSQSHFQQFYSAHLQPPCLDVKLWCCWWWSLSRRWKHGWQALLILTHEPQACHWWSIFQSSSCLSHAPPEFTRHLCLGCWWPQKRDPSYATPLLLSWTDDDALFCCQLMACHAIAKEVFPHDRTIPCPAGLRCSLNTPPSLSVLR